MPKDEHLQWTRLEDFSPGIRHRTMRQGGDSSPAALGAATQEKTYRCICLPGGGLGPLPPRTTAYARGGIEADIGRVQGGLYQISGLHTTGPVEVPGGGGISSIEAHVAFEYLYDADNNGSFEERRWRWERIRLWESSPSRDLIRSITDTSNATPTFRHTSFADYRAHPSDPTLVGLPLVSAAWFAGGGGSTDVWDLYPDPDTPTANGRQEIDNLPLDLMLQHQGRLVGFQFRNHNHGDPGAWQSNEHVWWTGVNSPALANSEAAMLAQGRMMGYGAAGSASAQELLLIKHHGGALTVNGDLDSPTIIALPGVVGTHGIQCIGVYTPIGFVYASRAGGIYAWQGGDQSTCLSPQLNDDFWNDTTVRFTRFRGRLTKWHDWIIVPRNWLYDINTQSWWRLEDPDDHEAIWFAGEHGEHIFAMRDESAAPVLYVYDMTDACNDYSWQSQPLFFTMDEYAKVREVIVYMQGNGTVTITIEDEQANTQSDTFVVTGTNGNLPRARKNKFSLQGSHLQVRIESQGEGASDPAPLVYMVDIGWLPQARINEQV